MKANQLWRFNYSIVSCWIPAHSGIIGNEQADMVAKQVLTERIGECQIPPSDLKSLLNKHIGEIIATKIILFI